MHPILRLQTLIFLGILLRVALILWGRYQDAEFDVKFTDIDYKCVARPTPRTLSFVKH